MRHLHSVEPHRPRRPPAAAEPPKPTVPASPAAVAAHEGTPATGAFTTGAPFPASGPTVSEPSSHFCKHCLFPLVQCQQRRS